MRLSIKLRYHERRLALVRSGGLRIEEYLGQTRLVRWNKFLNLLSSLGLMEDPSEAVEVNSRGGWFLPALQEALANYRVPVTTSDVVLLNSEIVPVADFIDPTLGWSDFVEGRLLHYRVPGFHYYMFQDEKAAALTAESLKPLLDRVDLDADRTANICSS
jgi:hypothetical protein